MATDKKTTSTKNVNTYTATGKGYFKKGEKIKLHETQVQYFIDNGYITK